MGETAKVIGHFTCFGPARYWQLVVGDDKAVLRVHWADKPFAVMFSIVFFCLILYLGYQKIAPPEFTIMAITGWPLLVSGFFWLMWREEKLGPWLMIDREQRRLFLLRVKVTLPMADARAWVMVPRWDSFGGESREHYELYLEALGEDGERVRYALVASVCRGYVENLIEDLAKLAELPVLKEESRG